MKIAVCLKRVPDTTSKIVIAADRASIDETGLKFVPNPYDEFALEAAIALKEKAGAGETVVVALGGDSVQETLRQGLAMGIDRAVHLQSAGSPDALEVAKDPAKTRLVIVSHGPETVDGISIKLSALFSRYEDAQRERALAHTARDRQELRMRERLAASERHVERDSPPPVGPCVMVLHPVEVNRPRVAVPRHRPAA